MYRYRLTLEYDGGPFAGWQRQVNGDSVQATIEAAVARLTGEIVEVVAAGRTDAGVHATGQVAHLDLTRALDPFRLAEGLNFHLRPAPIAVLAAAATSPPFHARFSAIGRRYRYRVSTRRAPPALARGQVWHLGRPLDPIRMGEVAVGLCGRHDFSGFRSVHCQAASALRTLDRLAVLPRDEELWIEADARSFLHNQVRIMVGTLVQAGLGRWSVARALKARDTGRRADAGQTAPPQGLCLTGVAYPAEDSADLDAVGDPVDEE
jgi:tRNA pseudouridine38-40 synthase